MPSPILKTAIALVFLNAVAAAQLITVTDDLGREVTLPSHAQRIVSLAPSITETLFAVGAGKQVVGVTDYCNYPEEASRVTRVGGMTNPSIESIMALEPDLIILTMEGNIRDSFDALRHLPVTLFASNPRSFGGIYKSIADIAALSGHEDEGTFLITSMKKRTVKVKDQTSRRTALFMIIAFHPLMVVGDGTFLSELIVTAGGKNLAAGTGVTYPTFSREAFVARQPEAIIITSDAPLDIPALLAEFPEWRELPAVKNNKVFRIDPDLVSRPGPRVIDGLEEVARLLQ